MNNIHLAGRAGQPITVLYLDHDHLLCQFPILVESENETGEVIVDSIDLELRDAIARKVQYLAPGTLIAVTGSLGFCSVEIQQVGHTLQKPVVFVEQIDLPDAPLEPQPIESEPSPIEINLVHLASVYFSKAKVSYYLDKRTGGIMPKDCICIPDWVYENEFDESLFWKDYLLVSHHNQEDFCQEMQGFIDFMPDPTVAVKLERALLRKNPLEEFEAVLSNQYTDGAHWDRWKVERLSHRVEEWLKSENIQWVSV